MTNDDPSVMLVQTVVAGGIDRLHPLEEALFSEETLKSVSFEWGGANRRGRVSSFSFSFLFFFGHWLVRR